MTTTSTVSPLTRRFIIAVDRFVLFIAKHWLSVAIVGLLIFAGLPFLAPVLMHYGCTGLADVIYTVYSVSCHQMAYRTFFLFGEQPAYTLGELQRALAVTNPGEDAFFWRDFLGNAQLGFKMAWCERDAAIYVSMLLGALLFGLVRTRLKPLDWRIYVLLLVPMAIDGIWQLFTSPLHLLTFLPVHESNYWLRIITGALFGIGSIWLIFPYIEEAMRDLSVQAQDQYARARARDTQARQTDPLSRNS